MHLGAKQKIYSANKVFFSANSCFLYSVGGMPVAFLKYVLGIQTGISTLKKYAAEANVLYDLQGRRVENAGKGIYIYNGRKVIK